VTPPKLGAECHAVCRDSRFDSNKQEEVDCHNSMGDPGCQSQTLSTSVKTGLRHRVFSTSALPSRAGIVSRACQVRRVPITDPSKRSAFLPCAGTPAMNEDANLTIGSQLHRLTSTI
jgi:hypothetical protein